MSIYAILLEQLNPVGLVEFSARVVHTSVL